MTADQLRKRLLITGGAGSIGSAVARHVIGEMPHEGWLSTSSPTRESQLAAPVADNSRFHFVRADIADMLHVRNLVEDFRPDVIMHLAAESHVDRSIDAPGEFIKTNIVGTYVLLEAARTWRRMPADRDDRSVGVPDR